MKWTFTSEQVMKGEVAYGLEDFRRDFYQEVKDNFSDYSKEKLESMFRLAYDVCYCEATQGSLNGLLTHYQEKGLPVDTKYLELIRDSNRENSVMLKAVLARELAKRMQEGLSSEDALKNLEEYHRHLASRLPSRG